MRIEIDETTDQVKYYWLGEETKTGGQGVYPYEDSSTVRKLHGGFPIYNSSSGLIKADGEMFIIATPSSASRRLCIRYNGITSSVSTT